jgi:hypothetical protein
MESTMAQFKDHGHGAAVRSVMLIDDVLMAMWMMVMTHHTGARPINRPWHRQRRPTMAAAR